MVVEGDRDVGVVVAEQARPDDARIVASQQRLAVVATQRLEPTP